MQASEIKNGSTFELDGSIYTVIEYQHVQRPRLAAMIKARIKNIETGQVFERRFNTGDNFGDVYIEKKEMQYLYSDGNLYYFMDTETYDQLPLDKELVADAMKYVKEGGNLTIQYAQGRVIAVAPPLFVNLKIVNCEPAVAGDTAKNTLKPAEMETGLIVKVPLFIGNEETIKVDTRTGEYVERA